MDDAKKTSQNLPPGSSQPNLGQVGQASKAGQTGQSDQVSQVPPVGQTATTAPAVVPAGAKSKEREPFDAAQGKQGAGEKVGGIDVAEADKVAKEEGDEYWENYAREIELEKEILEIGGVEKVESGEVKVPEKIAKEMGIRPVVEPSTPISKVADFSVRGVTLSDDQLMAGLTKPTSSGFRWLVEWFIYQLLKARFHIKRVKGRILRERLGASS